MTALWGVLAALGALAFVTSSDWARPRALHPVPLGCWSGLAVTGPAIAGMMQRPRRDGRGVRRLAVTP